MMSVSKKNEILEENLVVDSEWLQEEFEFLFDSKMGKHTEIDKKVANDVLDYFLENTDVDCNLLLFKFLDKVVENIEKKYSKLLC